MATLIGTPPNLVLAGVVEKTYNTEITFAQWFIFGFPVSVVLLLASWLYLTRFAFKFEQTTFPGGKAEINKQLSKLGQLSKEEKLVLLVFTVTALAWITRSFVLVKLLPKIDDTIIAVSAAIVLFIIPASEKGKKIIIWQDAVKLPWGILLLFGGGMALALGFDKTGLAAWIGGQLTLLEGMSLFLLILILIAAVNFLTEITSNLATTAMLLPVLIPLAIGMEVHPYLLLVSATLAASCAFMLPVATPPNAIVFGSGYLSIEDMVRKGIWMNIISIAVLTVIVYYVLPLIWKLS
jgi:sodium-dependent dicarboxylate transporter 2/3/5